MTQEQNGRPDHTANPLERKKPEQKRFKLIACEIFFREICLAAVASDHLIELEFLRKGLHDAGKEVMLRTIQEAVQKSDVAGQYDAILLGYGRCNDGVAGLTTQHCPLVIPRVHDCIAVFFGGRSPFDDYFAGHPGTYFRTTGWTERDDSGSDSVMEQLGLNHSLQYYIEKYGEENAQYIMETMGGWTGHYQTLAYIEMGLPQDRHYAELARQEANQRSLQFELIPGNMALINKMVSGNWPAEEFLVVNPGQAIAPDNDGQVLKAD